MLIQKLILFLLLQMLVPAGTSDRLGYRCYQKKAGMITTPQKA